MNLFIFNYKQGKKMVSEEIPAHTKVEAVRFFMWGANLKKPILNLNIQSKYGSKYPKQLFKQSGPGIISQTNVRKRAFAISN